MSKIFEALAVPKKQFSGGYNKYRVYKTATDFIEVSATTVKEALETSGVKDALKVEVKFVSSLSVIDPGKLGDHATAASAQPAAPAAAGEATST